MKSGMFDNLISLRHRVLTLNSHGENVESYTEYASIWSKKDDLRGREYFAAKQMIAETTTRFTIRWRSDVLSTDRIVENGLNYNIRSIAEIPRHRGLEIMTTVVID